MAIGRTSGRYAISDGATESYDSARWAKILAARFLERPHLDERWISGAVGRYGRSVDRNALSWIAQGAFDRGSFATVLGVVVDEKAVEATVSAVGDSLAVLLYDGDFAASHPLHEAADFNAHPLLYSTLPSANARIVPETVTWNISADRHPSVLCMTDALGAWCLAEKKSRSRLLLGLKRERDFRELIEAERASGQMRRDDTTLLVLEH